MSTQPISAMVRVDARTPQPPPGDGAAFSPPGHVPGGSALLIPSREAARLLSIGTRKLWALTNRGDLPCVRIGRSVRYQPTDLVRWTEAHRAGRRRP